MGDSYMQRILANEGPLEKSDRDALHDWRAVLEADCAAFGSTKDDDAIIRRIEQRLSEAPTNG